MIKTFEQHSIELKTILPKEELEDQLLRLKEIYECVYIIDYYRKDSIWSEEKRITYDVRPRPKEESHMDEYYIRIWCQSKELNKYNKLYKEFKDLPTENEHKEDIRREFFLIKQRLEKMFPVKMIGKFKDFPRMVEIFITLRD
jgi:hypothetical protein